MFGHPSSESFRAVPHIRPDQLDLIEVFGYFAVQVWNRRRVFDLSGINDGAQQKARCLHENMAFSPAHLLGPIVAVSPPFSVVFTD